MLNDKMVYCSKLKKEAEGLSYRPYPGQIGDKIFNNISKQAWQDWLNYQTMLINEYRLNLMDEKNQSYLEREMIKYLFEDANEVIPGFIPPES